MERKVLIYTPNKLLELLTPIFH